MKPVETSFWIRIITRALFTVFLLNGGADCYSFSPIRESMYDQRAVLAREFDEITGHANEFARGRIWRSAGMRWIDNEKMLGMGFMQRLAFEQRYDMTLEQLAEERNRLATRLDHYLGRITQFIDKFPEHEAEAQHYRAQVQHVIDRLDQLEADARHAIEGRKEYSIGSPIK